MSDNNYNLNPSDRPDFVDHPEELAAEDRVENLPGLGEPTDSPQHTLVQEAPGSDVTPQMLREDVRRADSWLHYHKGYGNTGFSPATQLTTENVGELSLKWRYNSDTAGLEVNPLVVPGDPPVMYITTSNQKVVALNAITGETFWEAAHDAALSANRGVAVWQDKVYIGTSSVELVAYDRYTGEQQWATSWYAESQRSAGPWMEDAVSHTATPIIYNGVAMVGQAGDSGAWTVMTGIDAQNGEVLWQNRTAPPEDWVGDSWRYSSNAPWMPVSVDPETDTVFFPVMNPDPQHGVTDRPGPNKHSNSVLALDVQSGEQKWATQLLPHDIWDYDLATSVTVHEMNVDGEQQTVVSADMKTGWTYVLDAATGHVIERSRPWEGVKQDHWGTGFFGIPPFAPYPQSKSEQASKQKEVMWPSAAGGTEWPPAAQSRRTGLRYIPVTKAAATVYHYPDWKYDPARDAKITLRAGDHTYITPDQLGQYSDGMYEGELYTSGVAAINPATGSAEWYEETGVFNDVSGFGMFPGGVTATATNLVFNGTPDGRVVAFDATNGDRLWMGQTDQRITAAPITWVDPSTNTQYVTVADSTAVYTFAASPQGQ